MSSNPSYIATPQTPAAAFVNADGTTFKTVITGGALGSRVDTLFVSNSDTANAYVVQLALQKSGVDYVIGESSVAIGSGTNGTTKSVALLNPTDFPGLAYVETGAIYLASGVSLRARVKTTIAGANSLQISGIAGDY